MYKFFLISGPCIIENEETPYHIAKTVKPICDDLGIEFIFKASYRKANRTRNDSFTGIGDEQALEIIMNIGKEFNIRTLTDVHESHEVPMVAEYVDVLQDRKSTRLNSSHGYISYAVFCLKKKK